MRRAGLILATGAAALLAACQADEAEEAEREEANGAAAASAEGKAEEGRISVKAPGFDLAINLPRQMADEATDRDNKILYPGSTIRGIHLAAAPGKGGEEGSEVDMRFASTDPVDKLLAWYRDPARGEGFQLRKVEREGEGHLLTGVQKRDGHPFKIRLSARPGGGTDGRLTVSHRD